MLNAVVISVPWQTVAEKAGFHKVVYFGEVMGLPMAGLGATDDSITRRPDLLKRTVRATLRAIDFVRDVKSKRKSARAGRRLV